jgi:hypothetical protein
MLSSEGITGSSNIRGEALVSLEGANAVPKDPNIRGHNARLHHACGLDECDRLETTFSFTFSLKNV